MSLYLTIFLMFFKIGLTSFNGGYGMMSMILDEGTRQLGLTASEFADMTALDLICSGPVALNAATYIGYIKGGIPGALLATLGVVLPSALVAACVIFFLQKFADSRIVRGLFLGITPACGGLLLYTALTLTPPVFFNAENFSQILEIPITQSIILAFVLFALALVLDLRWKVNPILLTLIGAVIGILFLQ